MKAIIGKRGAGKTTRLIRMSAETGCYIVAQIDWVPSIAEQAKKMGFQIPYPLSYQEFLRGQYYLKGIKGFLIDDVAGLLRDMAPPDSIKAFAVSMTEEPISPWWEKKDGDKLQV
jgi:adenylate kinase family enzyme